MVDLPPLLGRRYRLSDRIGSGGSAVVHRAYDEVLHRDVAVKVLRDLAEDDAQRVRFEAEARLLASLDHPGLVTVLDAGVDGAHPFLVMELVEGESLHQAIARGPLDSDRVTRIGQSVAGALAHAHSRGVVHRDVKPGNVLLGHDGRIRLADFGIARLLESTSHHTATGTTVGTAAYLAPEQVRGDPLTPAVDVYALGLVLLEALTAERAFPGAPTEAALRRLHHGPDVPTSLGQPWTRVLPQMTDADPRRRPSAAQLAVGLEPMAGFAAAVEISTAEVDRPEPATEKLLLAEASAASSGSTQVMHVTPPAAGPRRRTWVPLAAVAATALVVLLTAAVVGVLGSGDRDLPDETGTQLPSSEPARSAATTASPPAPSQAGASTPAAPAAPPGPTQAQQPDTSPTKGPAGPEKTRKPKKGPRPGPGTNKGKHHGKAKDKAKDKAKGKQGR